MVLNLKFPISIFYFLLPIFFFGWLFFPNISRALSITPAIVEKEASPGETLELSIKIFNEGDLTEYFYPQTENFRTATDGVSPEFLGNQDPLSAANWFLFRERRVKLTPGQTKEVFFRVIVPRGTVPGGHYAALFWSNAPPDRPGIGTVSRVGALLLFKIKGEVREHGLIREFSAHPDKGRRLPITFTLVFANLGNVHLRPTGQLQIYDYFGRLIHQAPINEARQAALPGGERLFSITLTDQKLYVGPFRAKATLAYGNGQAPLTAETSFWLGVNYLMWIGLAVLLGAIILIVRKKRKDANYE